MILNIGPNGQADTASATGCSIVNVRLMFYDITNTEKPLQAVCISDTAISPAYLSLHRPMISALPKSSSSNVQGKAVGARSLLRKRTEANACDVLTVANWSRYQRSERIHSKTSPRGGFSFGIIATS
jgi:hypothetical protein